jgi:hypothetical protein
MPRVGRTYWIKFVCCGVFLALFAISEINGDWYAPLGWPWNGLFRLGNVFVMTVSPFVLIYLLVLASRMK